jgi:hypothetical protein
MTTHYANASVAISGELIYHVRKLYQAAIEEVARQHGDR